MTIIGTPRSYHKKFKFVVEIDGIGSAAFQDCSELSVEAAVVEQWEGGALTADKSPGRLTFSDITLNKGATSDESLYEWFREVAEAAADAGLADPLYKRMVEIVQLDRDGSELRRWRLYDAWPSKFVAGSWDNTADENVMEGVTLAYRFFESVAGVSVAVV